MPRLWHHIYLKEKAALKRELGRLAITIERLEATPGAGLSASRPFVDIAVRVASLVMAQRAAKRLKKLGYEHDPKKSEPGRLFLAKRTEVAHHRLHLIHIKEIWDRHVVFRDYLKKHRRYKREYERLKKKGSKKARQEFIDQVVALAG